MLTSLYGCKKDDNTKDTGGDTSSESKNTEWELLEPRNAKVGDPVTMPRSQYITYPVDISKAEGITLEYWMPLPSNVSKNSATVNETEWARLWQEATGIKVKFIHPTQGSEDEEFSVMIASNKLPDIIEWEWTTSYTGGPSAAEQEGVLIYLDDYITSSGMAADLWQFLQDNPIIDREVKNDDGNYYCFPFIRGSKYLQCTSGLFYRADLMKAAGYDKSPVTVADWTEAMEALKAYGVEDPMIYQNIDALQNGTMSAYGIRPGMYIDPDSGKVKYGFLEEAYKEWMLQMNAWVKAGLLDSDVLTSDRSTVESKLLTGKAAATYGPGGGMLGSLLTTAKSEPDTYGKDFDLRAAEFLKMNANDPLLFGGASYDYATTSKASAVVTADCKYPDLAVAFLNYSYTKSGHNTINFGEEGVSYTLVDNVPTYTDEVMKNPNGLTVAVAMAHWGRGNMSGAFVQDPNYILQYYESQQQKEALSIWNDTNESQKTLIPPITLTEEESNRYAILNAQVDTYVKEKRASFFTGESNISTEWDDYVKNLKAIGIEEMISIYQAALDRYNAR